MTNFQVSVSLTLRNPSRLGHSAQLLHATTLRQIALKTTPNDSESDGYGTERGYNHAQLLRTPFHGRTTSGKHVFTIVGPVTQTPLLGVPSGFYGAKSIVRLG